MDLSQFLSPNHDHTIVALHEDNRSSGGAVFLDGKLVMQGADDDFYPCFPGNFKWGFKWGFKWNSQTTLVEAIHKTLTEQGQTVAIVWPQCYLDLNVCQFRLGSNPKD